MQTPDVVKTVLKHPRRLKELTDMLGDIDVSMRGRAAATLARLAESHPESLIEAMPQLREYVRDDSDYVRWHIIYALGEMCTLVSEQARECRADVFAGMDDSSRIVRMIAVKAASRLAKNHPDDVAAFFHDIQRPIPPELAKFIPKESAAQAAADGSREKPHNGGANVSAASGTV